jgi:murein L,D-transpeptidase YafK
MKLFLILCIVLINVSVLAQKKVVKKTTTKQVVKKTATTKSIAKVDTTPNPYYIIIDKSDYEMQVYDDTGWLATYPVVFGSKDLADKMYEGDKRTPEGEYTITIKKTNKQWGLELLLDYPNQKNIENFNQRKAQGKIPKGKKIGNGIAIHGTRPGSEWTVDNYINWTDGCISVKYSEMKELYDLIPQGTKVTIRL